MRVKMCNFVSLIVIRMKMTNNIPKRLLSMALVLLFCVSTLVAQEINANVVIDHRQIQGTNVSVFKTLETALNEFVNNQKWTSDEYLPNERIDCSFFLNIISNEGSTYSGSLTVTARRPIFNASISTTVLNLVDGDLKFTYNEFDQLVFNRNSLNQDLTAVIGFYVYAILGLDADTFREFSGDPYYNIAMGIVNSAESSNSLFTTGWDRLGSKKNRHVFMAEIISPEFRPYRSYLYHYHRLGLDVMAESVDQGSKAILDNLSKLEGVAKNAPSSYTMLLFFDVKTDEYQNILAGMDNEDEAILAQKKQFVDVLKRLDPSRLQLYNKLLN